MTKKSYLLLLTALVLGAAGLYFSLTGNQGSLHDRDRNFRLPQDADVVRLEMQKKNGESLLLAKDAEGIWHVNQAFRANESAVRELLGTLRHLNVRQPVSLAEQEQVNQALDQQGVLVEVYARTHWIRLPGDIRLIPRTKRVKRLLAGEDTPDGESTIMRLYRSEMPFAVHVPGVQGGFADLFNPNESLWRDPVVVDLQARQIRRIEVRFTENEEESFVIDNQSETPLLLHGGQAVDISLIDGTRLARYLEGFTELHYEKLMTGADNSLRMQEMFSPLFLEIVVQDQQERVTTLRFFRRKASEEELRGLAAGTNADPNRFFLQVNEGEFARAQYFVFNRIMRPLSYFLKAEAH
ncbi:MAG: DUF4340 domain-containing protein [Bacteroidales bacterium]|nr:DUF4340 domain-containing protein [Bacteroidales bacterium]